MRPENFISDTIVDLITGPALSASSYRKVKRYKAGEIASRPYINKNSPNTSQRSVITENYLLERLRKGEKMVRISENAIITPLARLLIEEGRIKVNG